MNAPDKIYRTTTYLDNDRGKVVYKEIPVKGAENIEYIRKDALLEWAKDELKLSKDVERVSEKSYEEGRQQVALNLIDKLNSM